jgi:hypothetical protein
MNDATEPPDAQRLPVRDTLRDLPLGHQTIWVRPIYSREELSRVLLSNDKWRSHGPARFSGKPISKIVLPEEFE